jgi:hypothetical protein
MTARKTKEQFFCEKWSNDFPLYEGYGYDRISKLCSKSVKLSQWFQRVNAEWVLESTTFDRAWRVFGVETWHNIKKKVELYDSLQKEYNDKLKRIRKEQESLIDKETKIFSIRSREIFTEEPLVLISKLNAQHLEIDDQIRIIDSPLDGIKLSEYSAELVEKLQKEAYNKYQNGQFDIADYVFE